MGVRDLLAPSATIVAVLLAMLPLVAAAGDEKAAVGSQVAYPTGASYDAFIATLPGFGLLVDSNGDLAVNDERCTSNGKSEQALVQGSLQVLVAAGVLCKLVPSGPPLFLQEACFVGIGIAALALQANAIVISQCKYQDGLVQAAEITAAYQNTRHMLAAPSAGIRESGLGFRMSLPDGWTPISSKDMRKGFALLTDQVADSPETRQSSRSHTTAHRHGVDAARKLSARCDHA